MGKGKAIQRKKRRQAAFTRLRRWRAAWVFRFEPELDGCSQRLEALVRATTPNVPDTVLLYDLHLWRLRFGWPTSDEMVAFWSPWIKGNEDTVRRRMRWIRQAYRVAQVPARPRAVRIVRTVAVNEGR